MQFDWKEKYKDKIKKAAIAMRLIQSGNSIFIGTGCGQPQHLVNALVEHSANIYDAHVVHLLTMGAAPYVDEKFRDKFKMNSFFVADNVRDALGRAMFAMHLEEGLAITRLYFCPKYHRNLKPEEYRLMSLLSAFHLLIPAVCAVLVFLLILSNQLLPMPGML